MSATDILKEEHRLIERVLDALERAAGQLERGGNIRPGFFVDAAAFASGFADGCHHRKEEGVLFGAMIAAGAPVHGGAIDMMREEHDQGRFFVRAMRDGAQRLASGDIMARGKVVANAKAYVALLRDHIMKEDEMLFPMADELIPPDAERDVLAGFDAIERQDAAHESHEEYAALVARLEEEAAGLATAAVPAR